MLRSFTLQPDSFKLQPKRDQIIEVCLRGSSREEVSVSYFYGNRIHDRLAVICRAQESPNQCRFVFAFPSLIEGGDREVSQCLYNFIGRAATLKNTYSTTVYILYGQNPTVLEIARHVKNLALYAGFGNFDSNPGDGNLTGKFMCRVATETDVIKFSPYGPDHYYLSKLAPELQPEKQVLQCVGVEHADVTYHPFKEHSSKMDLMRLHQAAPEIRTSLHGTTAWHAMNRALSLFGSHSRDDNPEAKEGHKDGKHALVRI